MSEILSRTAKLSPAKLFAGGLLLLGLVAVLDYVTGYELRFYVFYFPSIAIVSWSGNRRFASGIVLISALILLFQQYASGFPFSHVFYGYWSVFVGCLAFFFIAALSLEARSLFDGAQAKKEELMRANEKIERHANELAMVMDAVPAAIFVAEDAECRRITGNKVAHTLLGLPLRTNLSASAPSSTDPRTYRVMKNGEEIPVPLRPMQLAASGKSQLDYTFDLAYDDGTVRTLRGDAVTLPDIDGCAAGAVGAFLDVTERNRLEVEHARSSALKEAALASAMDAVCIFDSSGHLTDISDSCSEFMRCSPEESTPRRFEAYLEIMELYTPDGAMVPPDRWVLPRTLRGESGSNIEYSIRRKDTGETWSASFSFGPISDGDGSVIGGMLIARDITSLKQLEQEKKELELRMLRAQRLESLGLLAGGIAHTFNNQLQAIMSGCEMASATLPANSAVRDILKITRQSAERAAAVARHMLDYSGHGHFTQDLVALDAILADVLPAFRDTVAAKIAIEGDYAPELPLARLDQAQIARLALNILDNAREAMGEDGGVIRIKVGAMECSHDDLELIKKEFYPDIVQALPAGEYVFLEVSDSGVGMNEETLRRMFDPFFTTKFFGRGLGLATVLGVVRGHRGVLDVRSKPGEGTTLRVLFPTAHTGVVSEQA
ncbi:MAG: PAS domain-containing protein [Candidatus Hydrogenedentes bacterium]|nr:PAS domain-containing protein [Candidatus Hydrogenedentota bacterium]